MKKTAILLLLASGTALAGDADVLKRRALPDAASRLSCYDAIPVAGASSEPDFGLRPAAQPKKEVPATIRSTVVGTTSGWSPGSRIALPTMNSPAVEVSRGLPGAFFLQLAGHTSAARLTRVQ